MVTCMPICHYVLLLPEGLHGQNETHDLGTGGKEIIYNSSWRKEIIKEMGWLPLGSQSAKIRGLGKVLGKPPCSFGLL